MLIEQDDGTGPEEISTYDQSYDRAKALVYAVVQNASEEPIWDIVMSIPLDIGADPETPERAFTEEQYGTISIGPHETYKSLVTVLMTPYNRLPLKIEFRDNAGRDWYRDERGRLRSGRRSESPYAYLDEAAKEKSAQQQVKEPDKS
jgi:hypothetical protein